MPFLVAGGNTILRHFLCIPIWGISTNVEKKSDTLILEIATFVSIEYLSLFDI